MTGQVGESSLKHDVATDEVHETAALYALGALDESEVRAFDTHLGAGCLVCERELRKYQGVVQDLSLAGPQVSPPAYLKDVLMARLEREPRIAAAAPAPAATEGKVPQRSSASPGSSVSPAPVPRTRSASYLAWGIAAVLAVAAALSYFYYRQSEEARIQQEQQLASARTEAGQLQATLNEERGRTRELEQINTVLRSPGARVFMLEGQQPVSSASVAVFWDTQRSRWVVNGYLPPAPAGKDYQLWFVTPAARTSAGVLTTDRAGRTFQVIEVPPGLPRPAAAAITLEPAGGSEQPTMPIHALGKIG
jgi:anti-sigma-K factor RskA